METMAPRFCSQCATVDNPGALSARGSGIPFLFLSTRWRIEDYHRNDKGEKANAGVTYRFFLRDAEAHIAAASVIMCADDDEAKLRACEILAQRPDCRAIEVWDRDRCVHIQSDDVAAM